MPRSPEAAPRRGLWRSSARLLLAAALFVLPATVAPAAATTPEFTEAEALAVSQGAIGQIPGDHVLATSDGRTVRLSEWRGRPLIINMIYTGCTWSCPVIIQTLHRSVTIARDALGEDSFAVLTIGFDAAHDTPQRMQSFARQQGIDVSDWTFASADAATIDRLAAELGFVFMPQPWGFDHLAQTSVIDAEGVVYSQIYGNDFEPPVLVEPLKDLVFGRQAGYDSFDGLLNRIRLFCTLYDPAGDRYRFDYSLIIGLTIGALCLGGVGTILVRAALAGAGRQRET